MDPGTGGMRGAVNIDVRRRFVAPACTCLLGRIVHETEQRLLDESSAGSTVLHDAFLRARRTTKTSILVLDANVVYASTPAAVRPDRLAVGAGRRAEAGYSPQSLVSAENDLCPGL
jgi:hypothetical protein